MTDQLSFGFAAPKPTGGDSAPPRAQSIAAGLSKLAQAGVYIGTSSWKYPGWVDQIYRPSNYNVRGKFSKRKFDDECLAEYSRVFPTVCGDFAFYQFPTPEFWDETFAQVPPGFRFSLKVPEEVTVERFPDLPRYGKRAGTTNSHFMEAGLVKDRLLAPLEAHRDKLGVLIFEFGAIRGGPFREAARFSESLNAMFAKLPRGRFAYSVEVRNRDFIESPSPYLEVLRAHGVAHCFNSWTHMPPLAEQLDAPGAFTAGHAVARLLLRPGRTYQQAVDQFAPYEKVQDAYPEGREALRRLITRSRKEKQSLFAFVNNRFEGSAIETIESMLDA
jgi:uncharacterized protein YecE (DUF72 family)